MQVELVRITNPQQWRAYHDIRRRVLYEERGRSGVYDESHPDDRLADNHALLLIVDGCPRATVRLDLVGSGRAIVRTVAVEVEHQRRGLGRTLLKRMEKYARAQGVEVLEVNSAPDAVEFYARLGWLMIDSQQKSPLLRKRLTDSMGNDR